MTTLWHGLAEAKRALRVIRGTERAVKAEFRKVYEDNYLDIRKAVGRRLADHFFPELRRSQSKNQFLFDESEFDEPIRESHTTNSFADEEQAAEDVHVACTPASPSEGNIPAGEAAPPMPTAMCQDGLGHASSDSKVTVPSLVDPSVNT